MNTMIYSVSAKHLIDHADYANAALMAAAPDLLAHLSKLIAAIDRMPPNNPLEGLADEARTAIAKATGQEA